MHVFVTGGSGLTGPAIVAELIAAGHTVTGLARSDEAAGRLRGLGADTLAGALEDLYTLQAGAKAADGVIHMAFGGSFADPEDLVRRDRTAIETLGRALAGSGKPFVSTSGTLVMPGGRVTAEDDAPDPGSIAWFREIAKQSLPDEILVDSAERLAITRSGGSSSPGRPPSSDPGA